MFSPELITFAGITLAIGTSVWSFAWWLSNKLNSIMATLESKIDKVAGIILDKLEYHERHDDARFNNLGDSINALRIRNATTDALLLKNSQ